MKMLITYPACERQTVSYINEKLRKEHEIFSLEDHEMQPEIVLQSMIEIMTCDVLVIVNGQTPAFSSAMVGKFEAAQRLNKKIITIATDDAAFVLPFKKVPAIAFKNRELGLMLLQRSLLMIQIPEAFFKTEWVVKGIEQIATPVCYDSNFKGRAFGVDHKSEDKNLFRQLELLSTQNSRLFREVVRPAKIQSDKLDRILKQVENGASLEEFQYSLQWIEENVELLPAYTPALKNMIEEEIKLCLDNRVRILRSALQGNTKAEKAA